MKKASVGIALLIAAGFLSVASGMQQATTAQGQKYASGGVSQDDRAEMQTQRDQYSLWVLTAASKSGAYLSNVRVVITDQQKKVVFDAPLDGPWLFINLPLGRYTVDIEQGSMSELLTVVGSARELWVTREPQQAALAIDVRGRQTRIKVIGAPTTKPTPTPTGARP